MSSTYPNLIAPIGSTVVALEAIAKDERGKVAYKGCIYTVKAGGYYYLQRMRNRRPVERRTRT